MYGAQKQDYREILAVRQMRVGADTSRDQRDEVDAQRALPHRMMNGFAIGSSDVLIQVVLERV